MKIAFDHQIFSCQTYGGISRYIYELASHLVINHHQNVNIISPFYVNHYLKESNRPFKSYGISIPVGKIPKAGRLVRAVNTLLSKPLLQCLQPDIVHETYYARLRLAPKTSKVVLTVHDMIHERFPHFFSKRNPTRHEKIAAIKRANHLICVSEKTKQDLISLLNVDASKISVVYLGVGLTSQQVKVCDFMMERPYFLYVGDRRGYKNFENVLKAIALSKKLQTNFRIICFGGGKLTHHEKKLAAKLGFSQGDIYQISGPDAILAGLYQQASAFIYPSLYEGFGIPPLEAMRFSCPVACSNVSSIPEVIEDAGAYFDPNEIDDIKNKVEQLVYDDTLRTRLTLAGKKRTKKFSWDRCAADTLAVYRKLHI